MKNFQNKVAVITGASSGMGRELALNLARRGARLALCDIDAEKLAETVTAAEALGAEVFSSVVNIGEREQSIRFAEEVIAHYGTANLLFNNAGIAHHAYVADDTFKDFDRVIDVDFFGVVNTTKAFLPHLIASGDAHIINTSSVFGLVGIAGQSAYNSAKFAVRGFTEALRMEMQAQKHKVGVTAVHPGGIKTSIVANSTMAAGADKDSLIKLFDRAAITSAEKAAEVIINGVKRNRARVLIGPDAYLIEAITRIGGTRYIRICAAAARRVEKQFLPQN